MVCFFCFGVGCAFVVSFFQGEGEIWRQRGLNFMQCAFSLVFVWKHMRVCVCVCVCVSVCVFMCPCRGGHTWLLCACLLQFNWCDSVDVHSYPCVCACVCKHGWCVFVCDCVSVCVQVCAYMHWQMYVFVCLPVLVAGKTEEGGDIDRINVCTPTHSERERERQTDRQTERYGEKQTKEERERERDAQTPLES